MTLADGKVYWTTYCEDGHAITPWLARLTIRHTGTTSEYTLSPVDPQHPTQLLHTTPTMRFKTSIRLLNLAGVPLFEDRTEAFQAYPSIKLTEIEAGMRKTAKDLEELKAWVKTHDIKRVSQNAEAT